MDRVFEIIDNCDAVLIEFSESGIGMGIEAGYAKAKNIPVYVMQPKGAKIFSTAMKGICSAWFEYKTDDDIDYIFNYLEKEKMSIKNNS